MYSSINKLFNILLLLLYVKQVENNLIKQSNKKKTLFFVLIDTENSNITESVFIAKQAEKIGISAILIGGSSSMDQIDILKLVQKLKKTISIPVILFPGNVTGVVPGADAILFTSLLNSENPYFITKAQALAAPNVLRFGLEALPTAYILIGNGTTVEFIGSARGIPFDKPKLAAAYALAAKFFGMRFVYLEAGSGSNYNVTPEMVHEVRRVFDGFLLVGGGITNQKTAKTLSDAGADALVIGTLIENVKNINKLKNIIKKIQQ